MQDNNSVLRAAVTAARVGSKISFAAENVHLAVTETHAASDRA